LGLVKTIAVYPGSFDPATYGHLSVIRRAATLFEELIVLITHNPSKSSAFTAVERQSMLETAIAEAGISGVKVELLEAGLLVDRAKALGARAIVKGFRTTADLDYELPMAEVNRDLGEIETVFLAAEPQFGYVSSSLVREVAALGGDVSKYVPGNVAIELARKFSK
jgi:pantetheine-phosphate adenylyltransferase